MEKPQVVFLRNWPEGLFLLLVMFGPIAVAGTTSDSAGRFFLTLVASMVGGFVLWVAVIRIASKSPR